MESPTHLLCCRPTFVVRSHRRPTGWMMHRAARRTRAVPAGGSRNLGRDSEEEAEKRSLRPTPMQRCRSRSYTCSSRPTNYSMRKKN